VIVLGFVGAAVGAFSISGHHPAVTSPFNMLMVIPWFVLGAPFGLLTCLVVSTLSCMPLLSENLRPTFWSLIPSLVLIGLATLYFLHGAQFGVKYQGQPYVVGCALVGVVSISLLVTTWLAARHYASYAASVLHFLVLTVWMNSFAFAYMGELL